MATWRTNFDCVFPTQYWYCIKDGRFDLQSLRAKERYEINKGIKNFYVKLINIEQYETALYDVYVESLKGYQNTTQLDSSSFIRRLKTLLGMSDDSYLFGVFDKKTNNLCGFSNLYCKDRYIELTQLRTRVSCEKMNVNFALVYGILEFFSNDLERGCYICDGVRNSYHKTNFQNYLERYFGFRKAYCKLHVEFRQPFKLIFLSLFPFRRLLKNKRNKYLSQLYSCLTMYAWSLGYPE